MPHRLKHSWLLVPIFQIILLMSVQSQSFVQIGQIFKQRRDAAPHIRAALFREKIFSFGTRNRGKFVFILLEFRLFRGTENAQSHPLKIKKSWNSVPNHIVEGKNTKTKMLRIPFRTILQKRKTLGISF